jgi:sugar lactone lactonase YvrE
VVTTLAGSAGFHGTNDGSGSTARFWVPRGVAVDSAGNIFVADAGNHTIRKVTPTGEVTTLAGSAGSPGTDDGTGSAARFRLPYSVAVDSAGNVFVADQWFWYPSGVAVDRVGNVFVAGNNTIRKVTTAAEVTTLAGSPGASGTNDGTGSAARFYGPSGLAVDSAGNVFVTDYGNSTVRKVTAAGVVTTIGGIPGVLSAADGLGSSAIFANPSGIAVDSAGTLYVADYNNNRISKDHDTTNEHSADQAVQAIQRDAWTHAHA